MYRSLKPTALYLAMTCASGLLTYAPLPLQAAEAQQFTIPAGPLGPALTRFGEQTGLRLIMPSELVQNVQTQGLQGQYETNAGLNRLLEGSGLRATISGDTAVIEPGPQTGVLELNSTSISGKADEAITEGTGSYTQTGPSSSATGLALTLRETPQSLTVTTRQKIEDFNLQTIVDVIEQTPGVNTYTVDSERIQFESRGFNVNNIQYDGISIPISIGYAAGDLQSNTAIYEHIDVIKGSDGLMLGQGRPGASINMIRKKPTREFKGHITASAGSWDTYRSELDLSAPLTQSGNIRGRLVASYRDANSYLDYYEKKDKAFYGVLEVDLTQNTLWTMGADYDDHDPTGSNWSGLVQTNANGEFVKMPRSKNIATRWSSWPQQSNSFFSSLEHNFENGWSAKINYERRFSSYDAQMAGSPSGTLQADGTGLKMWVVGYEGENKQDSFSFKLDGKYFFLDREHSLVVGGNVSLLRFESITTYPSEGMTTSWGQTDLANYFTGINNWPYPTSGYDIVSNHPKETTRQRGLYFANRFSLNDDLAIILGSRVSDYRYRSASTEGYFYSEAQSETGVLTPYAGAVYDLTNNFSFYVSYTSIFEPQSNKNLQGTVLAPMEGDNYEAGIKGEFFDGRLNASLAYFRIEQDNYAISTGELGPDGGTAYEAADGVITKGYEFEVSGELASGWQVQGGYTHRVARRQDKKIVTENPENTFKLNTTYTLQGALHGMTIGAGARWRDKTWTNNFVADSYWLLDAMARYQINKNLSGSLNVSNLLDEKSYRLYSSYYTWEEPRRITASVRWDF
ncbi:TonB-dependent siderophore receptor [Pseudomonas sp. LRF_L74]|uniref:TonB-dependent siderophore receptor n=1 Tax=Pseudomonas sp. LRF_L74 TaxID=3369422 RepID=UPI003F632AE5